jgi:ceramide glucosyltransferase
VLTDSNVIAQLINVAGWACFAVAGLGSIYALTSGILVRRFLRNKVDELHASPPVSILKPLHGDEFALKENLEALCKLDYPGTFQLVFGVQDPHDPAIRCVENLRTAFPHIDISLVVDAREYGSNRKVSNLVNLMREVRYELLVIADSDIGVRRDYLRHIVTELTKPDIGLVTCLYRGRPSAGFWPRLSAMAIKYSFLPIVIFGLKLDLAQPCFGSTIALRRSVLQEIGGFEAFTNHLADDNAVGMAVRALKYKVAIPPMTVTHLCSEQSAGELVTHELRWARTIRSVAGVSFAGSFVTHPLPFALLGAMVMGLTIPAIAVIFAVLACRLTQGRMIDGALHETHTDWWLIPVRDLLSFAVFCGSFLTNSITSRGRRFHVGADGILSPIQER